MFFVFGPLSFVVVASLLFLLLRSLPHQPTMVKMPPLPTFWVWYPGTTPPLGLHIRPCGSAIFDPVLEKYSKQLYGLPTAQPSVEQDDRACAYAFAETGIIDWSREGKPYQVAAMAELLTSDPNLMPFLRDSLRRMIAEQNGRS